VRVKYAELGYVRIVASRTRRSPSAVPSSAVVKYVAVYDEYGLPIPDGSNSYLNHHLLPLVRDELPPSQRDRWSRNWTNSAWSPTVGDPSRDAGGNLVA